MSFKNGSHSGFFIDSSPIGVFAHDFFSPAIYVSNMCAAIFGRKGPVATPTHA